MDAVPGVSVLDFGIVVAVGAAVGAAVFVESVRVPAVAVAVVARTLLDAAVAWSTTIAAIWA